MTSTLVLSHVPFEDLGAFGPAIAGRAGPVRICEVGLEDLARLDPLAPDLMIVLGGPIGVYETDDYPFLAGEIDAVVAPPGGRPADAGHLSWRAADRPRRRGARLSERDQGNRVSPRSR